MKRVFIILTLILGLFATNNTYADNVFSVESGSDEITVNAYPNPANGTINVEINGNYIIQFYDLVGQKLKIDQLESSSFGDKKKVNFDLHTLSKGIYFIKVTDTIGKSQKMIKFKKL